MSEWSPRTIAAQALGRIDEATRALVPPLHVATTFIRDPDNGYSSGNIYGRPDNATVREAEAIIGALEGAATTLLFGSGMSASIALFLGLRNLPSNPDGFCGIKTVIDKQEILDRSARRRAAASSRW